MCTGCSDSNVELDLQNFSSPEGVLGAAPAEPAALWHKQKIPKSRTRQVGRAFGSLEPAQIFPQLTREIKAPGISEAKRGPRGQPIDSTSCSNCCQIIDFEREIPDLDFTRSENERMGGFIFGDAATGVHWWLPRPTQLTVELPRMW
jgi:hypothetical protein